MTDIEKTLSLLIQLQSVIHTLDSLSHEVIYKREFKMRVENFYNFIEKHIEKTTDILDLKESDQWVKITTELEKLTSSIKLTHE